MEAEFGDPFIPGLQLIPFFGLNIEPKLKLTMSWIKSSMVSFYDWSGKDGTKNFNICTVNTSFKSNKIFQEL